METAEACAVGTGSKALAKRIRAAVPEFELNHQSFRSAVASHQIHTITTSHYSLSDLSDDEMKKTYTNQVSRDGKEGRRRIYNRIIAAANNGLCCYCQYGQAKTLDHFVPQEHLPRLAIDPWNLVPACEQCNHKLLARWSDTASEQMLHPYNMPNLGRWLKGKVVEYWPIRIEFWIDPPSFHGSEMKARMSNEFEALGLGELFAVVSAVAVARVSQTLTRQYPRGNGAIVRAQLLENAADSFRVDENDRMAVLYEALANDSWFCDGGYQPQAEIRLTTPDVAELAQFFRAHQAFTRPTADELSGTLPIEMTAFGPTRAVGSALHLWRQQKGGQYIDLTVQPPRSWIDPSLDYKTTIVVATDGNISITTSDESNAWERIVELIGELHAPSVAGSGPSRPVEAADIKRKAEATIGIEGGIVDSVVIRN